jgi:AraC family transcriptional regulator
MGRDPARARLSPQAQLRDPRLQHIAWAIRAELEAGERERGNPLYAESLGLALAAQLLRGAAGQPAIAGAAMVRPGLSRTQCARIRAHVVAQIDGDLSLAVLSRVAGLGPSQFKALFHASFGLPVHQYVIQQRVAAARRLLEDRTGPGLAEIALSCGFSHQSHMARCMRRVLGVSPMMLRAAATR